MRTGDQGKALIKFYEGLKLVPYNDAAGFATIGYGHLLHKSAVTQEDLDKWSGFDAGDAEALLTSDLQSHENWINSNLPAKIVLSQTQFDALVSFDFNTGALSTSTLWKKVVAGDKPGALTEFGKWVHVTQNGVKVELAGLIARRAAEAALFAESAFVSKLPLILLVSIAGWMMWKFFAR